MFKVTDVEERIGKVKLNYQFYQGADQYSDGSIEDELLQMVKEETDIEKLLREDNRWPVLYHLSPVRQNIVDWYPFEADASVLEVGAGCGAISGALCRKAKRVVSVELSKRRSMINAYRNRECDNLEIMVGNFNDVELNEKFDYVTLIGVLEYANYYTDAENPFLSFLVNLKKVLKPNGKILMAIENKFGLKYWAGAREDHTGVFFDGLEGYHATTSAVRTFSKTELERLFRDGEFSEVKFYYPFPDYKFPVQVFSDRYLPKEDDLACDLASYDASRYYLFNETSVYQELIKTGEFPFFSNSFFVEAAL